ncbi:hypothetical protein A1OW_24295 [Enterovibrio norvegicus]|uniref:Uncharacterized protein n=1 Tax=Enterovibrio norvegicus TaxID=188144 RepID=A0ABV4KZY9_9GAMM|nr:hypothetical protein [Enterovibrio norvegicus]OEF50690.1 hypothetical protein A1OW_24295 [Enterovibrio norvegicus]OEF56142.1 hypothetical protein A1OU_15325 [Enterovibrio norvegicus]
MTIRFNNLDSTTRDYMRGEVNLDFENAKVYYSKFLKAGLKDQWDDLLLSAVNDHDEAWLEQQIGANQLLVDSYQKRKPKGGFTTAKVPYTAPQTLAEGEFNRFYCRGLCARAIEEGKMVQVYRGKEVAHARSASETMIGKVVDPKVLLEDLRVNIGVDTALGLPAGPNSGLTIKLS